MHCNQFSNVCTNALEALKIKQHADNTNKGKIEIEIYADFYHYS